MTKYPQQARGMGMPFIFDPGQSLNIWDGPALAEAMEGARVLISNDYELEMIMRMTGMDLDRIMELVQAVITTKGEKGSLLRQNGREVEIPAVPATEVKDPTGAGDAYRAGLLKGLCQGRELAEAAVMGATLASFAVARYGTQEYQVTTGEFEARLQGARRQMGWD
jgi:adenosine kinase